MGQFGGQPFFEGPIETKSHILTPDFPYQKLGSSTGGSSSRSKSKDGGPEYDFKGLQGENLNLLNQAAALESAKSGLKSMLYNAALENNHQIPEDIKSEYVKQMAYISQQERVLKSQESQVVMREDMAKGAMEKLGNFQGQYAHDPEGRLLRYSDLGRLGATNFEETEIEGIGTDGKPIKVKARYNANGIIKQGSIDDYVKTEDLQQIIESEPNVPDWLLNYKQVDLTALSDQIMGVFSKVTGSQEYGNEQKTAFFAAAANGLSLSDAIKVSRFSGTTYTNNKEAIDNAYKEISNMLETQPNVKKAYNYGLQVYIENYKDDLKYKDEKIKTAEQKFSAMQQDYISALTTEKAGLILKKSQNTMDVFNYGNYGINDVNERNSMRYKVKHQIVPTTWNVMDVENELRKTNVSSWPIVQEALINGTIPAIYAQDKKFVAQFNKVLAANPFPKGATDDQKKLMALQLVPQVLQGVELTDAEKSQLKTHQANEWEMGYKLPKRNTTVYYDVPKEEALLWTEANVLRKVYGRTPLNEYMVKDSWYQVAPGTVVEGSYSVKLAGTDFMPANTNLGLQGGIIISTDAELLDIAEGLDANGKVIPGDGIEVTVAYSPAQMKEIRKIGLDKLPYIDNGEYTMGGKTFGDLMDDKEYSRLGILNYDSDGNIMDVDASYKTANGFLMKTQGYTFMKMIVYDNFYKSDIETNNNINGKNATGSETTINKATEVIGQIAAEQEAKAKQTP